MRKLERVKSPFPHPREANPEGIVAVGGNVDAQMLIAAYQNGIFPWPHQGLPLLWFSPDPRFVLEVEGVHLHRSLRKEMRKGRFEIRADTQFAQVIQACAQTPRPGQDGTWIDARIMPGYIELHQEGYAHSVEAWLDGELVGGLYGISLGAAFFGESMFARVPNASKVAFATLLANLARWGIPLVDCQVHTEHLERFGAREWPRERYLQALNAALEQPTREGPWTFELDCAQAEAHFSGRAKTSSTPQVKN